MVNDGANSQFLFAGNGLTYNSSSAQTTVMRFSYSGSIDATFQCGAAFSGGTKIFSIAPQFIGGVWKYLVFGSFTTVNGSARYGVIRLNADASLDNSFYGIVSLGGTATVLAGLVNSTTGNIYIGGAFTSVNGVSQGNFCILDQDGRLMP